MPSLTRGFGIVVLAATSLGATTPAPPGAGGRGLEELQQVWTAVRDRFYDPDLNGLDWNDVRRRFEPLVAAAKRRDEVAGRINEMLSELRASHTRYYTTDDPEYYFLLDLFREVPAIRERTGGRPVTHTTIGIFTHTIDGERFVRAVVDGGPAERAGLVVGDRLVAADGKPFHPVRSFEGKAGKKVSLRVQRTADPTSLLDLTVVPASVGPREFYLGATAKSARVIEHHGRKIAYVRVWSYAGRENHDAVVASVLAEPLASAEALVLDLRDGWGGANPDYLELFCGRVPVLSGTTRDGKTEIHDTRWRKPAALLVNGTTRSGKEVLAFGFRRYGYGPVVGERTAGAVLAGGGIPIGSDGLLYLASSDIRVDGLRLEGVGVEPDVPVPFALPYAQGKDPQLEQAIRTLLGAEGSHSSSMSSETVRTAVQKGKGRATTRSRRSTRGSSPLPRIGQSRCGAVTFIQRFGGAVNLNVHLHTLVLDGGYVARDQGEVRFLPVPPPADAEVARVTMQIARRIARLVGRRGLGNDADPGEADPLPSDEPLLDALYAASVHGRVATGPRTGQRVTRNASACPHEHHRSLQRLRMPRRMGSSRTSTSI